MNTDREIRVLIAEDDALVAGLTRAELKIAGLSVVGIAVDGRQAVEMVRVLKPDVVLMDIAMPVMDGIAAATAIQQECPTPVVILSAHDETEMTSRATAAGIGAFIVKPSQASEMVRAITIAMARHADLLELRRLNFNLQQALADVRTLTGFLPICCSCKKIRDDKGYWNQVEIYVMQHTDAKFSHGYCPECLIKHFPGIDLPESAHY